MDAIKFISTIRQLGAMQLAAKTAAAASAAKTSDNASPEVEPNSQQ